jgi:DNA gyrase/topoisomerase IV subunit B
VQDGPHFSKIVKQISTSVKTQLTKKLNNDIKLPANFVKNNIFIIMNTQMIKPGWTGQRKDVLSVPPKKLEDLILPDKTINAIVKHLYDIAVESMSTKTIPTVKKEKNDELPDDKYVKAKLAGTKHSMKCRLLAAEGDSAKSHTLGLITTVSYV